jgi:hypothetical protein
MGLLTHRYGWQCVFDIRGTEKTAVRMSLRMRRIRRRRIGGINTDTQEN